MKSAKALSLAIARVDVSSEAAAAARAWEESGVRMDSHAWAFHLGQIDRALAPVIADFKRKAREWRAS